MEKQIHIFRDKSEQFYRKVSFILWVIQAMTKLVLDEIEKNIFSHKNAKLKICEATDVTHTHTQNKT